VEKEQGEERRPPLSFSAWIAIVACVAVLIVLGLHVPAYLQCSHEQMAIAEFGRLGATGRCRDARRGLWTRSSDAGWATGRSSNGSSWSIC
jgi:type IV secretory pathway VirB3-like protein